MTWWLADEKRARDEKAAFVTLQEEYDWPTSVRIRFLDNLQLCVDVEVGHRGEKFELAIVYPTTFPATPPIVLPRGDRRLSDHQYGAGGDLCLQWRPDNWDLALARLDERFPRLVDKLARVQLLVLDDWGTHTLNDRQRLDLLEIFEERYRRKSTLITAQLPVAAWHEMIGEATLADAILDRIVHNAHRITLEGDSMRKRKAPTLLTGGEITEINHL